MAGASASLPAGVRLSDPISLGVIARAFPADQVRRVLSETGRASARERDLPAQVMVYYAIALALYMGSSTREVLRCLLEGLEIGQPPHGTRLRPCLAPPSEWAGRATPGALFGTVGPPHALWTTTKRSPSPPASRRRTLLPRRPEERLLAPPRSVLLWLLRSAPAPAGCGQRRRPFLRSPSRAGRSRAPGWRAPMSNRPATTPSLGQAVLSYETVADLVPPV